LLGLATETNRRSYVPLRGWHERRSAVEGNVVFVGLGGSAYSARVCHRVIPSLVQALVDEVIMQRVVQAMAATGESMNGWWRATEETPQAPCEGPRIAAISLGRSALAEMTSSSEPNALARATLWLASKSRASSPWFSAFTLLLTRASC
jgi:hypothetical protein